MGTVVFEGAGVDIAAQVIGERSDPSVLLVHGGGQTKRAWTHTAGRLAEHGWYTVAIDLRGHGDSGWSPSGSYSIDDFAEDLRCVAAQIDKDPVFVGASLGGNSSLIAIAEAPVPLGAGLVLVDVAPRTERAGLDRLVALMTGYPDGFASLDEAAEALSGHGVRSGRNRDSAGLRKVLRQRDDGRWGWNWDPAIMAAEARASYSDQNRLEEAARRLTVPTMLVRGADSDVVTAEAAQQFAAIVPGAELQEIPGVGHTAVGTKNSPFEDAILSFLAPIQVGTAAASPD